MVLGGEEAAGPDRAGSAETGGGGAIPSRLGPYAVTGLLGRGGMGIVYAGEDPRLRRPIAIKVLSSCTPLDPDGLARFEREARLLAALNHPSIATIYSLERHEGVHLITMELVPGCTLAQRMTQSPPDLCGALEIAEQVAAALEAAHEAGVIHLDLKPANIRIRDDARVKLLDFGLARASLLPGRGAEAGGDDATLDLAIQGTPGYMSPEQVRRERVDHRADVWAFGCVLFELMAGRPAFSGRTGLDRLAVTLERPPDWDLLPTDTPVRIRELLKRCLEKDQDRRIDSMAAVRRILSEESGRIAPPGPVGARGNESREHPTNVPLSLTSFIGRETAQADLVRRLERERLVTVTGPGGCGKTRLSLEVGRELLPRFPDGVWLVELAPIVEPERVPQAVANAIGVREDSRRSLEVTLRRHLRARHTLLLLDNCEHVLEECARLAEGRWDQAALSFRRSLEIRARLGGRLEVMESLESLGLLLVEAGAHRTAACLLGAAASIREEIESSLSAARAERMETAAARLLGALGDSEVRAARAEGSALTVEEAVALASSVALPPHPQDDAR